MELRNNPLIKLASSFRYNEIINIVEGRLEKKENVSVTDIWTLCDAYHATRNYSKTLQCANLFENKLASAYEEYSMFKSLMLRPHFYRAMAYLDFGKYNEALEEQSKIDSLVALNYSEDDPLRPALLLQPTFIKALAQAGVGDFSSAKKSTDQYIKLIPLVNSFTQVLVKIKSLELLDVIKDCDVSLQTIYEIKQESSKTLLGLNEIEIEYFLGRCLHEKGQLLEAEKIHKKNLQNISIQSNSSYHIKVLVENARIADTLGSPSEAINYLKRAVDVIEQQRSTISTESDKIGFADGKQMAYGQLISILIREGLDSEAFEYVERSKARALVDLLALHNNIPGKAYKAEAGTDLSVQELTELESEMYRMRAIKDWENEVKTRSLIVAHKNKLNEKDPELASIITVAKIPNKIIQSTLAQEESLIEYYYSNQSLFAFVMTRSMIKAVKLDMSELDKNVLNLRRALSNPTTSDHLHWSQKTYQQLIQPVLPFIQNQKLIIVPHGVLHHLPFNALSTGSEYLIDKYNIRILPSASVLKFITDRQYSKNKGILILGNPDLGNPKFDLNFATEEAIAISKLFQDAKVLLRSDATKTFVGPVKYFV